MTEIERAAKTLQESYDYMNLVFPSKKRPATIELLGAIKIAIAALREKVERENPKALTMEQLRDMNDQRVWAQYFGIGMYALVAYHSDPDGDDGDDVYLTNNLGGRSTYQDVLAEGGEIYDYQPKEAT